MISFINISRLFAAFLTLTLVILQIVWLIKLAAMKNLNPIALMFAGIMTSVAILSGAYAFDGNPGRAVFALSCGIFLGFTGFILGFFGPMLFSDPGNQAPLFGIFFAGPLGFIVGSLGGLIYHSKRRRN